GWNPNASGEIHSIAVQSDGKVIVGGFIFGTNSIGGQMRNGVARLDPASGAADSWDPNADGAVFSIGFQTDGKIVVGGDFFSSIGGQTRAFIARLDPVSGKADSFDAQA